MRIVAGLAGLALLAGGCPGPPDEAVQQPVDAMDVSAPSDVDPGPAPDLGSRPPDVPEDAPAPVPDVAPEPCVSDLSFFQEHVQIPIVEPICLGCHVAYGRAADTQMVLHTPLMPGYLAHNFDAMKEMASYQKDGVSLLLLKPTGAIEHGGGVAIAADGPEAEALSALLERFAAPTDCPEPPPSPDPIVLAELAPTLRAAKLQLIGELPTAEELIAVTNGGEPAFRQHVMGYLGEPAFLETLRIWFNDVLLTDRYFLSFSAVDAVPKHEYPNVKWFYSDFPEGEDRWKAAWLINKSLAREPLDLIAWVVQHERPITEILTADYILLNYYSARSYGVGAEVGLTQAPQSFPDPGEFVEGALPEVPHAGILTSRMFMARYPTTPTNMNRHRSRVVWDLFAATDVLEQGDVAINPPSGGDVNLTVADPSCAECHAQVDPIAGCFANWGKTGAYEPGAFQWPLSNWPAGFGDTPLPEVLPYDDPVQWLGHQLAGDPRFALAMVHVVYRGLVGRPPVRKPTDTSDPGFTGQLAFYEAERAFLEGLADALATGGYLLPSVVDDILLSRYYRAVGHTGLDEQALAETALLGTAQVLSGERLQAQLEAVVGFRWRDYWKDLDQLLDPLRYLLYYGGINSDDYTERVLEESPVMANVAMLMALSVACHAVAHESKLPADQRLLLPQAVVDGVPRDSLGHLVPANVALIKQNIVHLHARVLGEHLAVDHPEIEATWQLFLATWDEGMAKIESGEEAEFMFWVCGASHPVTGAETDDGLTQDPQFVWRSWEAVLVYLLGDFRFLYQALAPAEGP